MHGPLDVWAHVSAAHAPPRHLDTRAHVPTTSHLGHLRPNFGHTHPHLCRHILLGAFHKLRNQLIFSSRPSTGRQLDSSIAFLEEFVRELKTEAAGQYLAKGARLEVQSYGGSMQQVAGEGTCALVYMWAHATASSGFGIGTHMTLLGTR